MHRDGMRAAAPSFLDESLSDDELPTLTFARDARFDVAVLRAPPSEHRWSLPSLRDPRGTDQASRELIARIIGELPLFAPPMYARLPLRETNVFLLPPRANDPTPPWAQRHARLPRPRRRSALPLVTVVVAIAIGVGLWRDPSARASIVSDLAHAGSRAATLVDSALDRL